MIISLLHKNYCISVHTISDPFDETLFVSEVDIGSKDGKSIIKITANQSFAAESDAEVCGLEMGRDWIDKHQDSRRHRHEHPRLIELAILPSH
jgi:hypothetical protein